MTTSQPSPQEMREQILSQTSLPTEPVHAFGMDLTVRTMEGTQRDQFEQKILDAKEDKKPANIRGLIVALCVVDDSGKRVFEDGDAAKLGRLSAKELDRVFEVAARLNGIGKDDLKEMEGNSDAEGGEGSSSS